MTQTLTVVKIGGNVIDHPAELAAFAARFAALPGPKLLVHGGGVLATQMAGQLGIPVQMHQGRRITDPQSLKVVAMVYAGWINKDLVARLQALGCNAIGLSGADLNSLPASKRPPRDGVDYGLVGDLKPGDVNDAALALLLGAGCTPVFSAITHDGQGQLLNTNADTVAATLAIGLSRRYPTRLIFCFEQEGVLGADKLRIPHLDPAGFAHLKASGVVSGGMLPKLENAFEALRQGVREIRIQHARDLGPEAAVAPGTTLSL